MGMLSKKLSSGERIFKIDSVAFEFIHKAEKNTNLSSLQ